MCETKCTWSIIVRETQVTGLLIVQVLNLESEVLNLICGVMWLRHACNAMHAYEATYRHKDRQTNIHTYTQTRHT